MATVDIDTALAAIRSSIEAAVTDPDDCLPDEAECLANRPVHEAATINGKLQTIYAGVDALALAIVAGLLRQGLVIAPSNQPEPIDPNSQGFS